MPEVEVEEVGEDVFTRSIKSSSAKMAVVLDDELTVGRCAPKKEVLTFAAMLLRELLPSLSTSPDVGPS